MDEMTLPEDFRDFLKLLNNYHVEYLLIGGYAVFYHGYPEQQKTLTFGLPSALKTLKGLFKQCRLLG